MRSCTAAARLHNLLQFGDLSHIVGHLVEVWSAGTMQHAVLVNAGATQGNTKDSELEANLERFCKKQISDFLCCLHDRKVSPPAAAKDFDVCCIVYSAAGRVLSFLGPR